MVRMVTGDNLSTARAISLEAGILTQEDLNKEFACIEGSKFREIVGEDIVKEKDPRTGLMVDRVKEVAKFQTIAS